MTLDSETTAAQAYKYATRYLSRRKEPAISVELDAVDLSEATGETLDAFAVGKKFRLALPGYGVTVEQWITGIRYQDVYGDPRHVTLTLANAVADLALRMNRNKKQAEDAEREATWNTNGLRSTVSAQGTTISAHERVMTGNGTATDYLSYINIKAQGTTIAQHTTHLSEIDGSLTNVWSEFSVQEGLISSKVSQTDYNGNTIVSYINQTATTITISAQRVDLDGYITATLADAGYIFSDQIATDQMTIDGYFRFVDPDGEGHNVKWKSQEVVTGGTNTTVNNIATANSSGLTGFITLTYLRQQSLSKTTIYYMGY